MPFLDFSESMGHIDRLRETDRLHDSIGISLMLLDSFWNSRALEAPQGFRVGMLASTLGEVQCETHGELHFLRESR